MGDPTVELRTEYRILVLEDSRTQATKLCNLIRAQGWQADWVESAERALAALAESSPDLLVVDFHLPGMQGDEFCRRVRMNVSTRGIPILMLTADGSNANELRGLESGADDYIPKAAEDELLVLRLQSLLRKIRPQVSLPHHQTGSLRQARILAIDDSPTYLAFLSGALRQEGYKVTTADGGCAGLERFAAEPFDCVLVDLLMPDLDGIAVCRRISETRLQADTPTTVLMLTAQETKEDMTGGLEAGADDFVGKTNDIAVIKARVRALLRRKFFQEENRRILEELKEKELDAVRARAETEAAEARAALADELQQTSDKLAAANRELETFSYSVSHDLRTPLRGIEGFSSALLEDYDDKLDDQGRHYLARIREGCTRMAELIDDLLDLARIARAPIEPTSVDVAEIAREIARDLRERDPDREVTIVIADGLVCTADPRLCRVVMENLLGNAWKYSSKTAGARIEVGRARDRDRDALFVRDNGAGFDMAHAAKLFDTFQRLHDPSEFEGSGIGLSTVKRVIDKHEGDIWGHGEPGRGATFYFTFGPGSVESTTADRREAAAHDVA